MGRCHLIASRTELGRGQLPGLAQAVGSLEPCGSIAYKLARVAGGLAHGTLSRTPKCVWDVAAGTLLVEEAGGKATDLYGRPLDGRAEDSLGVVAAAPELHRGLLAWLASQRLDCTSTGAERGKALDAAAD
jgi:myo-inositol-1(or 4)-monophosphatase